MFFGVRGFRRGALGLLGAMSLGARAEKPRDWSGEISSTAARFRADTGVTHPILYSLPEWSRNQAADLDLVSRNSAGLSILEDSRRRFVPLSVNGFVVGRAYDVIHAYRAPGPLVATIFDDLEEDKERVQRVKASAQLYYLMRNFAYSFHYTQQRNFWLENSGDTLHYQFFRDAWFQFSSGGRVFDSESSGRLDFGGAVKTVVRVGAEQVVARHDLTNTLAFRDADMKDPGLGIGIDYSLLWTSPGFEDEGWGWQLGLAAKDIGTTPFLRAEPFFRMMGYKDVEPKRFPVLPNDTLVGVGVKLPNFRDGWRSALRLEWNQWTRPIPASKKWAASYEMRFPFLASLYTGYRAGSATGGVGLRFRGFELDLGTFVDLWGNGERLEQRRAWMMELRSVF